MLCAAAGPNHRFGVPGTDYDGQVRTSGRAVDNPDLFK
jgi:hypothetical protein